MDKLVDLICLREYENIFRMRKMNWLWGEYLKNSKSVWENLEKMDREQLRLAFHSWKSNSQIFGMNVFAGQCAAIEEKLSKKNSPESVSDLICRCRECYQNSVVLVETYFKHNKKETDD